MIKAKKDEALSGKIALVIICIAALIITFIRYKDDLASSGVFTPDRVSGGNATGSEQGSSTGVGSRAGDGQSEAKSADSQPHEGDVKDIGTPGMPVDINKYLAAGKYTIIDFWSPFCPPCIMIKPHVERLAAVRKDIAVREVNINRKDVRGIDWGSPVARQYELQSVPQFKIFGPDQRIVAEKEEATKMVLDWIGKLEASEASEASEGSERSQ